MIEIKQNDRNKVNDVIVDAAKSARLSKINNRTWFITVRSGNELVVVEFESVAKIKVTAKVKGL